MAETSTEEKELSTAQHRLIAALLVSRNVREACKASKTPERTAWTWLQQPRFKAALASAEAGQIGESTRRLMTLTESAVDVLKDVLQDKEAAHSVRIRAAQLVIESALKLRELQNVEARLAALEAALYAKPEAS